MQTKSPDNLIQAIHNVQQTVGIIQKGSKAQVGTRIYKYADLKDVWEAVKPVLAQNGLTVVQSPSIAQGGYSFVTTIHHKSGESIKESMPFIIGKDDPQSIGSAITYYRRYMLMSMLGLVADDDTDAKEHRSATAEQKMKLVGAAKLILGDDVTPDKIISTIQGITGKHPSNIREDEADRMVDLVKAFKGKSE
jgi:hypothetical protein